MYSNVEVIKLCYFGVFARYQLKKIYHGFYDVWAQDSMIFGPCFYGNLIMQDYGIGGFAWHQL
jgi:hypothetical protein